VMAGLLQAPHHVDPHPAQPNHAHFHRITCPISTEVTDVSTLLCGRPPSYAPFADLWPLRQGRSVVLWDKHVTCRADAVFHCAHTSSMSGQAWT
jgi:hypothetical protein